MLDQMHILAREFVRWNPEAVEHFRIPDPTPRSRPQRDAWGGMRKHPARASVLKALRRLALRSALREA